MVVHKRNNILGMPVCWDGKRKNVAVQMSADPNEVDCVPCLRKLLDSAVRYGNGRRVQR